MDFALLGICFVLGLAYEQRLPKGRWQYMVITWTYRVAILVVIGELLVVKASQGMTAQVLSILTGFIFGKIFGTPLMNLVLDFIKDKRLRLPK